MKDYGLIVEKRIIQLFVDNKTVIAGSILPSTQALHAINELLVNYDDVKAKDDELRKSGSSIMNEALKSLKEKGFLSPKNEIRLTEKGECYIRDNYNLHV